MPARSAWGRLPLVWILPAVVVLAGGFVVIREKIAQGTSIEIRFENAEGLETNKTKVRYKDVDIGEVRDIRVGDDRKEVIVTADIHRNAKAYLVEDTRFWVVRPRISGAGVSGLATLVSGAYISVDVGHSAVKRDHFVGLEVPPIVTADLPGREFILHADDLGSLDIGSSVFYRHITAGQVVGYSLDPGGTGVTIKIFINAPFDLYVTGDTRFWQASGIDMSVNANGVKLRTESLASILEGGVAFGTPPGAPTRASRRTPRSRFSMTRTARCGRPRRKSAPSSCISAAHCAVCRAGAPVDLQGITVGEVKSLDVEYDERGEAAGVSGRRGAVPAKTARPRAARRVRACRDAGIQQPRADRQLGCARPARRIEDRQSPDRPEIRLPGNASRCAQGEGRCGMSSRRFFRRSPAVSTTSKTRWA